MRANHASSCRSPALLRGFLLLHSHERIKSRAEHELGTADSGQGKSGRRRRGGVRACSGRAHMRAASQHERRRLVPTRPRAAAAAPARFGDEGPVRFFYNLSFLACFSVRTLFFFHNKSVGTVFQLVFSAKRTGRKLSLLASTSQRLHECFRT